MTELSIEKLKVFLDELELTPHQFMIGRQIFKEIKARIGFLIDVGLDYLTWRATGPFLVARPAYPSGDPDQFGLVGVAYILDEPSIGLHQGEQ